jgi:NADH-quinone oxidoreductase subunit N
MAGVPPFAGFFAKLDILYEVVGFSILPALVAILISVVSTFYYLRLSKLMFFEDQDSDGVLSMDAKFAPEVTAVSVILLSVFMVFPEPLYILAVSLL